MALHLLQGGLGGETLFILEYAHAGGREEGSVGGRRGLLGLCTAGTKSLHFKKEALTPKMKNLLNLIKFETQLIIKCPHGEAVQRCSTHQTSELFFFIFFFMRSNVLHALKE